MEVGVPTPRTRRFSLATLEDRRVSRGTARRGAYTRDHLDSDIGEQQNVATMYPAVVERLTTLADRARNELGDYDRIGRGVRFFEDGLKWPRRQLWLRP